MDIDKLRTAYGEACLLVDVLESDKSPAQVEARQKMYELEDQLPEEWRMIVCDECGKQPSNVVTVIGAGGTYHFCNAKCLAAWLHATVMHTDSPQQDPMLPEGHFSMNCRHEFTANGGRIMLEPGDYFAATDEWGRVAVYKTDEFGFSTGSNLITTDLT